MRAALILLAALVACVYGQQSLYLNAPGATSIYSGSASATLHLALVGYPCSATSCNNDQCSHKYCRTDAAGTCQSTGDETWTTVAGNVAFTFACCQGTNCGQPPMAGGFITLQPSSTAGVGYVGPRGQCYAVGSGPSSPVGTSTFDWHYNIDGAAVMAKCGSGYNGWRPVLADGYGNVPGGSTSVQVSISQINNVVDPIFFNASVAITAGLNSAAPAANTFLNGPTAGVYQTIDCGASAQIAPPPACSTTQSCTGNCGCGYISMLNRTYTPNGCGTGCPTTTFLFQVCILCDFGFSYLAICNTNQGGTVIVGMGGAGQQGTTYVGDQGCSYTIGTGGNTISGCTAIKWAGPCSWSKGQCDYFPVTLAGDVSDYTFNFNLHAGQGQTFQVIQLNTGTCPYGSCPDGSQPVTSGSTNFGACPCPAPPTTPPTPPPTTQPPPPPPTTTQDPTDTSTPAPPPPTTAEPTPEPTPEPTTPNNCPVGICSVSGPGSCDACCYTNPESGVQSYCIPDANGLTYTQTYIIAALGQTVPSNAIRPRATTPGGCQLDCNCNVATVGCDCSATIDTACICNVCTGVCEVDALCRPLSTPPLDTTCAPCPISEVNGLECAGNGLCDCGNCFCAASREVEGLACDEPTGAGRYTTCGECVVNANVWCDLLGIFSCATAADCTAFGGVANIACEVVPEISCEDNCTCPNGESHGQCITSDGIAQCVCDSGWHGGACCARGGLSKGAIAGITAGAISGIVIAAVVGFVLIGWAAKKGVDWVALKSQNMAAAHENPVFKPRTTEHENALHEQA